tara:strand:+ start:1606 stop:1929 length:324 start_codon:yes stop_codon:yes gene_type:complete
MITNKDAVLSLYEINHSGSGLHISGKCESDLSGVKLSDGSTLSFTFNDVLVKKAELQADYDSKQYQRDRKLEYPTIEELVVALYDESDKASIIERRNAVKAKYPKPE